MGRSLYFTLFDTTISEALPGGSHVARLNFKTSRVGVYKCLWLIVGFAVTVTIWPREVVSCRDFMLRTVATFWAMSLAEFTLAGPHIIFDRKGSLFKYLSLENGHSFICYMKAFCKHSGQS